MHKSKSKFCNIARKWWVIFCTGKCTESCVFVWTPWNTQLLVFFFASFTCVSHCTSLSQLDLRWVSFESQKKAHVTERKKMNPNAFISMLHFKFSSLVLLSNFWGVDWAKEAIFWHATVSSGFFSLLWLWDRKPADLWGQVIFQKLPARVFHSLEADWFLGWNCVSTGLLLTVIKCFSACMNFRGSALLVQQVKCDVFEFWKVRIPNQTNKLKYRKLWSLWNLKKRVLKA